MPNDAMHESSNDDSFNLEAVEAWLTYFILNSIVPMLHEHFPIKCNDHEVIEDILAFEYLGG
jgi:hypothetical protein